MENTTHSCMNCTVYSLGEGAYNISGSSTADILFFGGLDTRHYRQDRYRQRHDNSKTKALIGQVHGWRAGSRRNIALEAIERGTARIPLGCHAEINKSALIGQVRDTAQYPAGITPSVNGPVGVYPFFNIATHFCNFGMKNNHLNQCYASSIARHIFKKRKLLVLETDATKHILVTHLWVGVKLLLKGGKKYYPIFLRMCVQKKQHVSDFRCLY